MTVAELPSITMTAADKLELQAGAACLVGSIVAVACFAEWMQRREGRKTGRAITHDGLAPQGRCP